jgi:hypothetical protein
MIVRFIANSEYKKAPILVIFRTNKKGMNIQKKGINMEI